MTSPAARAAATWLALTAGHDAGDYLIQLDRWAVRKGATDQQPVEITDPATGHTTKCGTREGRAACAAHCLTYVAAQAAALYATTHALRTGISPRRAAAVLAASGITHYWIDRHAGHWSDPPEEARGLVRLLHKAGKGTWLRRDPAAGLAVDQALHRIIIAALAVAAAAPERAPR